MKIIRGQLLILLALLSGALLADQPLTYERINLAVSAGREVDNDTLVGILFAQAEGNDPARLASEINQSIGQAVELAKSKSGIRVQTLDYNTSPLYRSQTLTGWRVRQSIRLESRDAALLSELIGELQATLAVGSISYTISPERLKASEEELISEAIEAFNARAQLVVKEMGRKEYRLVQMNLNTPGNIPEPRPMVGVAMTMREQAPPPALEAGSRRIEVNINATSELKP